MKSDTSKFTNVKLVYDDGSFAIAKGKWNGKEEAYGCRWYEEDGLGYPQTYGKPQWMLLPERIGTLLEGNFALKEIIKHLV